jgi:hypothetical protein
LLPIAFKKIQDGVQFETYLQKSIEGKILLQKSIFLLGEIYMQEFPNLEIIPFFKNTIFSKFLSKF